MTANDDDDDDDVPHSVALNLAATRRSGLIIFADSASTGRRGADHHFWCHLNRPPGKRRPIDTESSTCWPFLHRDNPMICIQQVGKN